MEDSVHQDIQWALETIMPRRPRYKLYRDYYRGSHRQVFEIASEQQERYFRALLERVSENLCKPVVRCFAERMSIESWEGNSADAAAVVSDELRLSRLLNRVHTDALKLGDSYVLVWPWGAGVTRLWKQRPDEMAVRYDANDPDVVDLAAKIWKVRGTNFWRLNLLYDNRMERYIAEKADADLKAQALRPYSDGDGPEVVRHGYGKVPVVRFAHDADEPEEPGLSILEDVLPLQDVLNKQMADLLIASEFFAMPMRIFTGVQDEVNPVTGKSMAQDFNPRRDRNLFFGGSDTKATQLPSADLKAATELTDASALKIARVTGVPMHYLVLGQGQFPSGEALRTAEARLVSKVDDLHDEWGPQWAALMELLGIDAQPVWTDPAHITETERLERLETQKRLGVPWRQTMLDLGYTSEQIDEMEAWKHESVATAQSAFSSAFDAE